MPFLKKLRKGTNKLCSKCLMNVKVFEKLQAASYKLQATSYKLNATCLRLAA
jgi:hypothetical protein